MTTRIASAGLRRLIFVGIIAAAIIVIIALTAAFLLRSKTKLAAGAHPSKTEVAAAARFKDCERCPELVAIPAGDFSMGSKEFGDEQPIHAVTITRPFAISRFEITFDDWAECLAAKACRDYNPSDEGWGRANRPVINVSWDDAQAYVKWLRGHTGQNYRLPSEAEWEYAARGGKNTSYWWGDDAGAGAALANCADCVKVFDPKTSPVGAVGTPNGFGLSDALGNVWEWVEDCYQPDYSASPVDGSAVELASCKDRVLRGGSWTSSALLVRAAVRASNDPTGRFTSAGFRVLRELRE